MVFSAEVRNGKVIWSDPEAARQFTASLEGKRVNISIDVRRPRRSEEQSRYYRGVVCRMISEHTGYEPEEVHEILRGLFLVVEKNGRSFPRSTATLNTADMSSYIERCIRWAAIELGIAIPEAA